MRDGEQDGDAPPRMVDVHPYPSYTYMRTLSPEGILRGGDVDEVGLRGEARHALGVMEAEVALLACGVWICVSDVWEAMSARTHTRTRARLLFR